MHEHRSTPRLDSSTPDDPTAAGPAAGAHGEGGIGSESSGEPGRRETGEPVERAMVDPDGRMNDGGSDWQAFGERNRRGPGTAARPTFDGFDWQDP
ncbi:MULTISPECIES: hypothetical protein, partial [Streptomyces]|uniref:hypothetical protein n=1 Tax=Streptomyces TaxID=1883 RepID=UPI0005635487